MKIDAEQHGQVTVLTPRGPLIGSDVDQLQRQLAKTMAEGAGPIVLDASTVAFLDSHGLEVLVDTTEQLIRSGGALKLCGANDIVREVLDLTDLAPLFEQFDDVDAAIENLQ